MINAGFVLESRIAREAPGSTRRAGRTLVGLVTLSHFCANIREGATDAVNINMENLEQRFHAVLEGCAARDPEAAEAALTYHFQAALQRILGMV